MYSGNGQMYSGNGQMYSGNGQVFKDALTKLEKSIVDSLGRGDWAAVERADEKLKETISFWVESLTESDQAEERDDARVFIEALMTRYKTYLVQITDMQTETSNELKKLQNEKKAINQYLNHKL